MNYSVIGILDSGCEVSVLENASKRDAWDAFKHRIGALGYVFVIRDTSGATVYGWDRWAGEWSN